MNGVEQDFSLFGGPECASVDTIPLLIEYDFPKVIKTY
jgi:hypothetical protein